MNRIKYLILGAIAGAASMWLIHLTLQSRLQKVIDNLYLDSEGYADISAFTKEGFRIDHSKTPNAEGYYITQAGDTIATFDAHRVMLK